MMYRLDDGGVVVVMGGFIRFLDLKYIIMMDLIIYLNFLLVFVRWSFC